VTDRRANIFNNILLGLVSFIFFRFFFHASFAYVRRIPILYTAHTHYQKTGTNFPSPPPPLTTTCARPYLIMRRRHTVRAYGKSVVRKRRAGDLNVSEVSNKILQETLTHTRELNINSDRRPLCFIY